jgi:hypothetical protein
MDPDRKPKVRGGLLTSQDIDEVAHAGEKIEEPPANNEVGGSDVPAPTETTPQPTPKSGIIYKTTAKVVDVRKATQNPKVVVVENKTTGSNDPLKVLGSVYLAAASRASTAGFTQAIKQHKALSGKNPTYAEFMQMAKQSRVEFAKLPPYKMYGYDSQTGGIVILEDKAEKIRLYKAAGIPIEDDDKKYE